MTIRPGHKVRIKKAFGRFAWSKKLVGETGRVVEINDDLEPAVVRVDITALSEPTWFPESFLDPVVSERCEEGK
ncbi:MAG: hypothetical protein K6T51_01360 [Rubrobacteraceae bacterium]|nr:hypothetical protein [Rubrobacteraceae bacterium]